MSESKEQIVMICCSVLETEIRSLCKEQWPAHKTRFLDSTLHMYPDKLAHLLESQVDRELTQGKKVLLIYGDCCPQMAQIEAKSNVARTRCNNCCDLLLGSEEYKRLSNDGVYFLMPEWTRRWKEIFTRHLGIDSKNIVGFMQEMHTKMVYLETDCAPVQESALCECAKYCGLPYEIKRVSIENLRSAIEKAFMKLTDGKVTE